MRATPTTPSRGPRTHPSTGGTGSSPRPSDGPGSSAVSPPTATTTWIRSSLRRSRHPTGSSSSWECDMQIPIWGGVECTMNRVRDRYIDQLRLTRHDVRPDDLERLADLGIRALRYPVLWGRHAPGEL